MKFNFKNIAITTVTIFVIGTCSLNIYSGVEKMIDSSTAEQITSIEQVSSDVKSHLDLVKDHVYSKVNSFQRLAGHWNDTLQNKVSELKDQDIATLKKFTELKEQGIATQTQVTELKDKIKSFNVDVEGELAKIKDLLPKMESHAKELESKIKKLESQNVKIGGELKEEIAKRQYSTCLIRLNSIDPNNYDQVQAALNFIKAAGHPRSTGRYANTAPNRSENPSICNWNVKSKTGIDITPDRLGLGDVIKSFKPRSE